MASEQSQEQVREMVVCIPMDADAFILNERVCDSGLVRIAPITQPDYLGLRPNPAEIQHDILPPVDVHNTQPSSVNSRVTVVETPNRAHLDPSAPATQAPLTGPPRKNRIGAYVHWRIPRCYRAGTSAASGTAELGTRENPSAQPMFRAVPNRWLVIRTLNSSDRPDSTDREKRKGWIIESDRLWKVDELGPEVDLETDVSPYVNYSKGDENRKDILSNQGQYFIGEKLDAKGWKERGTAVPRASLTVMNASNLLFADNTHHNSNVFSMIDDFEYQDSQGNTLYLQQAVCDYTVIGWHSDAIDDPLGSGPYAVQGSLTDRLKALFLETTGGRVVREYAALNWKTRTVCHSTIYNVQYDRSQKPSTPAEKFAAFFTADVKMEPVSIGTTPLDSVLTFLKAHDNEDTIFGPGTGSIANIVMSLEELLYASEDGYDSRVKALDLIYANNFARSSGGNEWKYSGTTTTGDSPARPSTTPDVNGISGIEYLNRLNELQLHLDACNRKLRLTKWSLFATWWKYVSDPQNTDTRRVAKYQDTVNKLRSIAQTLIKIISDQNSGLQAQIDLIIPPRRRFGPLRLPKVFASKVAKPPYFQRRDPTLCIAGMDPGWDDRYSRIVMVRLAIELPRTELTSFPVGGLDSFLSFAMRGLLAEALDGSNHSPQLGFKTWSVQPWCPLSVEWEATYFHIPFKKWAVGIANSPVGNNHDQVRYTVTEPLHNNPDSIKDQRTVSGRILLLPQPAVNLQALIAQTLDIAGVKLPPALDDPTNPNARDDFIKSVGRLKFVSAELSGITSNLLTVAEGSHVQPNLRRFDQVQPSPLAEAIIASQGIGLTNDDFQLIGDESAQTPYGTLVDFSRSLSQPFKGVSHGQFRFTKLNIIDKFGQVISAIDPEAPLRTSDALPDTIHPCLGDQVCPGLINNNHLNTVTRLTDSDPLLPGQYPLCPYIQLTPAINQEARLNAAFVLPTSDSAGKFNGWKPTGDWDQPIWGWVVVNYADYGLQFFTGDGTFYVEMNLGGPTGTVKSVSWLPFDPPSQPSAFLSPQLDQLIKQMTGTSGATYLQSFWDMITKAVENMPYAPPEYAAYASAIVGKPLALTNAAVSLELATAPLQSQVTLPLESDGPSEAEILFRYDFPVKIGDADRPFDGVVGYFDTDNTTTGSTDWTKLHTYFGVKPRPTAAPAGDPRVLIEPADFPTLSPYYVEPDGPLKDDSFSATHATHLMVKTVIVDPYTALHVYSSILPITSLQLPAWTVQAALRKMTAFFTLGPCLITRDVPKTYDSDHPLSPTTWIEDQQRLATTPETAAIRLPLAGKKGLWNWLQPYIREGVAEGETETRYNALQVGEEDGRIRNDPAPYTLVEGFLQLARPLAKEDLRV